jgi:predicted amidophosphoribosyltransferase
MLWCGRCAAAVVAIDPMLWPPPGIPGVFAAAGPHEGLLRAAILTHKHDRNRAVRDSLMPLLGRTLAVALASVRSSGGGQPPVLIVPVPPSALRPARRPVAELTGPLCGGLAGVTHAPVLVGARRRRPQKGLDAIERARNVRGAFRIKPSPLLAPGAVAVVVDDVVTTGATLTAAFAALADAGMRPVAAVALARADAVGR